MGKLIKFCCCGWWSVVSLLLFFVLIAAFIVYMVAAPFWHVAAIIWGVTGGFIITGMILVCTTCFFESKENKGEKGRFPILGTACGVFYIIGVAVGLAFTFAALAFVVHLDPSSFSDLEVVYLGGYDGDIQKVMVRSPSSDNVTVETSNSTLLWIPCVSDPPGADGVIPFSCPMAPNTNYTVRVIVDGKKELNKTFSFITPRASIDPGVVTFSHGSCQFPYWNQGLPRWNDIARLSPDFVLFIGDFIYSDVVRPLSDHSRENYESFYREIFATEEIRRNFVKWPTYHMFDDHELYNNFNPQTQSDINIYANAIDGAWFEYLGAGNPSPFGSDVYYYTFDVGVGSFFVLDGRSYRTRPFEDNGTMIGALQRTRLLNWLDTTPAVFKFIVTSGPWTRNIESDDGWSAFANERTLIMNHILNNSISGVSILSGDDHTLGVYEVADGIYEFNVSPVDGFGPLGGSYGNKDRVLCREDSLTADYAGIVTYAAPVAQTPVLTFRAYKSHDGYDNPVCGVLTFELNTLTGRFEEQ